MKTVIGMGISLILFGLVAKNLPGILKTVRDGQIVLIRESTSSKWGKVWIPDK